MAQRLLGPPDTVRRWHRSSTIIGAGPAGYVYQVPSRRRHAAAAGKAAAAAAGAVGVVVVMAAAATAAAAAAIHLRREPGLRVRAGGVRSESLPHTHMRFGPARSQEALGPSPVFGDDERPQRAP